MRVNLQYGRVFGELFWAASKAMLIIVLISTLKIGFGFYKSDLGEGFLDSFGAAILMHILGYIIYLPMICIFVFLVGTPLILYISKKGWNDSYCFMVVGAVTSFLFLQVLPIIILNNSRAFSSFILSTGYCLIGGALTGYFLHRQLQNLEIKADLREM